MKVGASQSSKQFVQLKYINVPETHGVSTPSPITIEVPRIVAKSKTNFANLLFSNMVLILGALLIPLLGNSSWKVDTSLSSASWFGIKLTFACRHKKSIKQLFLLQNINIEHQCSIDLGWSRSEDDINKNYKKETPNIFQVQNLHFIVFLFLLFV